MVSWSIVLGFLVGCRHHMKLKIRSSQTIPFNCVHVTIDLWPRRSLPSLLPSPWSTSPSCPLFLPLHPPSSKYIISWNFVRCQFSLERECLAYSPSMAGAHRKHQTVLHMCWATLTVAPELTILSFYLPSRPPTQQNASVDRQLAMKLRESERLGL